MTETTTTAHATGPYRDAVRRFARRLKTTLFFSYFEIKKQSAGSGLGLAWIVLEPLLRVSIYVFVFTVVLGIRLPGPDAGAFSYATYILMGLIPWMYVSAVLSDGANLVHSYAGFIRQPNFPYRILPDIVLLKQLPAHLVGMVILLLMVGYSGKLSNVNFPLILLVYLLIIVTIRGTATSLGVCAVILPDIRQALNFVLMLAIFLSPILYMPAQLGDWIIVGLINPFSYLLTPFKYAMTGEAAYTMLGPWNDLGILALLAAASAVQERWVFKQIRNKGIDYVA